MWLVNWLEMMRRFINELAGTFIPFHLDAVNDIKVDGKVCQK